MPHILHKFFDHWVTMQRETAYIITITMDLTFLLFSFLENAWRGLGHWKQVRDWTTFIVLGKKGGIVLARKDENKFDDLILNLFLYTWVLSQSQLWR